MIQFMYIYTYKHMYIEKSCIYRILETYIDIQTYAHRNTIYIIIIHIYIYLQTYAHRNIIYFLNYTHIYIYKHTHIEIQYIYILMLYIYTNICT